MTYVSTGSMLPRFLALGKGMLENSGCSGLIVGAGLNENTPFSLLNIRGWGEGVLTLHLE